MGAYRPGRIGGYLDEPLRQLPFRLAGSGGQQNPAAVQKSDTGTALRLVEVRGGDDDRRSLPCHLGEDVPEFAARHRINAAGRFVEKDDLGGREQACCERKFLLHTARKRVGTAGAVTFPKEKWISLVITTLMMGCLFSAHAAVSVPFSCHERG